MTLTASKVPEITLAFWIIKIAATTLGETGGDAVSMTLNLGYLLGTALFAALFLVLVTAQIRAKAFHPPLFWAVIVATTTVGTTMADFAETMVNRRTAVSSCSRQGAGTICSTLLRPSGRPYIPPLKPSSGGGPG